MGRNFSPMGTCELNLFLPRRGLPAMKAVGVRMVRSASERLESMRSRREERGRTLGSSEWKRKVWVSC